MRAARDLVGARRRSLDRHGADRRQLEAGLADSRRQLSQLQHWLATVSACPDPAARDQQLTEARVRLRGQQRQFWCQYLLAQRLAGPDGERLPDALLPLQTLLQETQTALEEAPAALQPSLPPIEPPPTLTRLPTPNHPLHVDSLSELRDLVPLYRRLTAQLGQAEAAAPQRDMLGRLSVALIMWKELDLRLDELEAEQALAGALLASCLGEQVNTDDPELITRLEVRGGRRRSHPNCGGGQRSVN